MKVATPPELLTAVMLEFPDPAFKVTVLPDTGLFAPSINVTVMVDVLDPFAAIDAELALTVEFAALIAVTAKLAEEVDEVVLVAVLG